MKPPIVDSRHPINASLIPDHHLIVQKRLDIASSAHPVVPIRPSNLLYSLLSSSSSFLENRIWIWSVSKSRPSDIPSSPFCEPPVVLASSVQSADDQQQVHLGYSGGSGPPPHPSPPNDHYESPMSSQAHIDDQSQGLTYAAQNDGRAASYTSRQYPGAPSAIPSQTTTANVHAYARRAPSPAPSIDPSCLPQQIRVILLFPLRPLRAIPLRRLGRNTRRRFLGQHNRRADGRGGDACDPIPQSTRLQFPTIVEGEEYQPDMREVQRTDFDFSRSSSPTGTTFTRDSYGPVVGMQQRALPRRNTF